MKTINQILILAFSIACFATDAQTKEKQLSAGSQKRFESEMEKGKRKSKHFHFKSAVAHYKQAFEIKRCGKASLKLADTYRMLNESQDAAFWYKQSIDLGGHLSQDDYLHYAQMLKSNGAYDEAISIFKQFEGKEEWIANKIAALNEMEVFYTDQHAYDVAWEAFNSSEKDFSPTYLKNEVLFVSNRAKSKEKYMWDHSNYLELFTASEDGVKPFHSSINSSYHEGPSTFFDNGTKMFFTRNNYHKNKMGVSKDGINKLKIYYSEVKKEDAWSSPVEFIHNSDEYSTAHPSITEDGRTLYFASDMPGGFGGVDIYKSELRNGSWSHPINLGPEVNTPRDEMFPFIHKGTTLYFSSTGHHGLGGLDLYKYRLGTDEEVKNLGYPMNTQADDFGISFYKDTNKGFFSSNRSGGMGDDDIYSFFIYDHVIDVTLVDAHTGEKIATDGRIDVLKTMRTHLNDNGETIPKTSHSFGVEAGTSFFVTGSADGYYQGNLIIQIPEDEVMSIEHKSYEIELTPIDEGGRETEVMVVINNERASQLFYKKEGDFELFEGNMQELKSFLKKGAYEIVKETYLTNIWYDFDQFAIRTDAARSLDKIVTYLKADEELNILLESHTDERGSNEYNKHLARERVEAAKNYLIAGGVANDRIYTGSYGEEQVLNDCTIGCDESQHQKNRRTEIRIEVNKRKKHNQFVSSYAE